MINVLNLHIKHFFLVRQKFICQKRWKSGQKVLFGIFKQTSVVQKDPFIILYISIELDSKLKLGIEFFFGTEEVYTIFCSRKEQLIILTA
jgi:hypothetical protein